MPTNAPTTAASTSSTPARPKIRVRPNPKGNTGYSSIDYGPITTNKPIRERQWISDRCFTCTTDRSIADFLLIQPGATVVGEYQNYFKNFDKRFLKSLETPIVIAETDTDEEKELKEAVIQMRKEFKERLDAGENLEKLMKDNWYQMKELAAYKDDIEKQVKSILREKKDTLSDQDAEDLVKAANEMLEGRGVSKMSVPSFLKRRLQMKQALGNKTKKEEKK